MKHSAKTTANAASKQTNGPQTWIKTVHYLGDGWTVAPAEEQWISDVGRRDPVSGDRIYTASGEPWGRPSWKVGEEGPRASRAKRHSGERCAELRWQAIMRQIQ